jgi:hypothetical protein
MRKTLFLTSWIFIVVAVVFSVLPLDTLAFLPIGIALLFILILLFQSKEKSQKRIPLFLLYVCVLCSVFVVGKLVFISDTVEVDKNFEQQKVETKKEAQKELEELEALENDLE